MQSESQIKASGDYLCTSRNPKRKKETKNETEPKVDPLMPPPKPPRAHQVKETRGVEDTPAVEESVKGMKRIICSVAVFWYTSGVFHIHTYTYIHTYIIQLTPLGAFQWPITSSVVLIGLLLTQTSYFYNN